MYPKKELSRGFEGEELKLNAEGCQELGTDSFSSDVADSSTSAQRHLLVFGL